MTNVILPARRPYGSPAYSPNSRPVYYGGPVSGGAPTAAQISAIYTALGAGGDFWDTHDPVQMGGISDGGAMGCIAGTRASIALCDGAGREPTWDLATGDLVLNNTTGLAQAVLLEPQSTLGDLQDAFFICYTGTWSNGFHRVVCVDNIVNDVLFDLRIGTAGVNNPSGVSGLVQDAQANIAAIAGITVPTAGQRFTAWCNRTSGGNATFAIKIGDTTTSGTITKGASTGTNAATVRFTETYATSGYKFSLNRPIFVKGASLSQDQIDTMVSYSEATYVEPTAAAGYEVFGSAGAGITLSAANRTATANSLAWASAGLSGSGYTTGKFSVVFSTPTNQFDPQIAMIGVGNASFATGSYGGSDGNGFTVNYEGTLFNNATPTALWANDMGGPMLMEVDLDASPRVARFYHLTGGNVWSQTGADLNISSLGVGAVFPIVSCYDYGTVTINSGQYDFTPPTVGVTMGWPA